MTTQITCDELTELIPSYALGALTDDERSVVEAHLPACSRCQQELSEYHEVVEGLAYTVPLVPAPARVGDQLQARLQARLAEAAQDSAVTETQPPGADVTRQEAAAPVRPTWWDMFLRSGWAVAAVALLLLAYVWIDSASQRQELEAVQTDAASLRAELDAVRLENVSLQQELQAAQLENINLSQEMQEARGRYRWLVVMLTDPDSQHYFLTGEQGRARFVVRPDDPRGVLIAEQLPELESGQEYQLWLVHADGKRDSGGTFQVSQEGRGWLVVDPPAPWDQYLSVGITVEPEGGSPGPTGPPVAGTEL